MHDKGSKGVCKRVAMRNAWPMHEKYTCGVRCVKYTTNEPNMFFNKETWENLKFGTHWSPNKWKNVWKAFYQTPSMHTMNNNVKQYMNIMKSTLLIHVLSATRGQHPMQINKRNQSLEEIWQKLRSPNPYDKNPNQEHKTLQNII